MGVLAVHAVVVTSHSNSIKINNARSVIGVVPILVLVVAVIEILIVLGSLGKQQYIQVSSKCYLT